MGDIIVNEHSIVAASYNLYLKQGVFNRINEHGSTKWGKKIMYKDNNMNQYSNKFIVSMRYDDHNNI